MNIDADYTLEYFKQTQRNRFKRWIRPAAVYRDRTYPERKTIVLFDSAIEFPCETVFYHSSTFAAKSGQVRSDRAGQWIVMSPAILSGTSRGLISGIPAVHFLFVEEEIRLMFRRWIEFRAPLRPGVEGNLLKIYYQNHPRPRPMPGSYEATHILYDEGWLFCDHRHVRRVLGIEESR